MLLLGPMGAWKLIRTTRWEGEIPTLPWHMPGMELWIQRRGYYGRLDLTPADSTAGSWLPATSLQ